MIDFTRTTLSNGLRLLVHEDDSTPMAAVSVIYNVGARDERADKTGFAHLFEHLMFGGSANVPDFDEPMQLAGGENNAFTNSDVTNFYNLLPAENIETAFWLESDRMLALNFDEAVLDVQRRVVIEEFKETCLNQPYGDVWHHLNELAYTVHPYQWPTIGKVPQHVEEASMEDVKDFFYKYYRPNNAVLVVAGNVKTTEVETQVRKWFEDIPAGHTPPRRLPAEPIQQRLQQRINTAAVPVDALYLAFHMTARLHPDYYATDLLSDILCNGGSSRLYRSLLKERRLFTSIDCYLTGSIDPGLVIIEGKPAEGVTLEQAEAAIWEELDRIRTEPVDPLELEKVVNKVESALVFSEASILNKALNLSFFEVLDKAELINEEVDRYAEVTVADIQRVAREVLTRENCSQLYYKAAKDEVLVSA